MTRKSFRLWLVALLLGPACALALEIGEIQVSSALNQLLDAKIPLPTLTPDELGRVSVKLAAPPLFQEFGIDRAPVLANLVFSIQYDAEGEVYVKIVSTKPIREPSLALLLEFGWPRGKTIREFTVFLDPVRRLAKRPDDRTRTVLDAPAGPGSGPAPEEPALEESAPVIVAAVPMPVETPAEPPSPVAALPPPPPVKTWEPGATYGPVAPGEGLWAIALKLRPDPEISRDQMMQALFRANPQAFSKAGIDGLKTGAVLRIPTLGEIADFTGSPVARRLAEAERATTSAMADDARSKAAPAPVESMKAVARDPKAFPLAPPVAPEPVPVAMPPAMPPEVVKSGPESEPKPETVKTGPEPAPPAPEPVAVVALPEPEAPEPAVSEPAVVASVEQPEAVPPAPEPVTVVAPPEPEAPEPAAPEPVAVVASLEPEATEPAAQPDEVAAESSSQVLEPVSATPLLFLAVSEMMATVVQIPVMAIPEQAAPLTSGVDLTSPEPVRETATLSEAPPPVVAVEPVPPAAVAESAPPMMAEPVSPVGVAAEPIPPAAVAEPAPPMMAEPVSPVVAAEPIPPAAVAEPAPPMMAEPVSPVGVAAEPIPPAAVIEPASESVWSRQVPVVMMPEPLSTVVPEWTPVLVAAANLPATVEKQAPPAVIDSAPQPPRVDEASAPAQSVAESTGSNSASTESPEPPVAGSAEPSAEPPVVESVQPAEPAYKGGDQYGPVSANERLWDIAGKVRPDPAIGKDLMMKALFAANPQAFSKPNMDSLRTGAMLRVPTLREIVDATGSRVAKQLLDQQRAAKTPPAPPVLQSPAPATEMPAITEPSLSAPVGGKGISE